MLAIEIVNKLLCFPKEKKRNEMKRWSSTEKRDGYTMARGTKCMMNID